MTTTAQPGLDSPAAGPSRYAGLSMSQHPLLQRDREQLPAHQSARLRSGDSVRVHTLIKEGDKERVQVFEGVVIGQHRGGSRASFTVRKVSYGVGVERIFPLHTSRIEKIEVVSRGQVRRARLNYLRELRGQGRPHQGREEQRRVARTRAAAPAPAAAGGAASTAAGGRRRHRSRLASGATSRRRGSASAAEHGLAGAAESLAAVQLESARAAHRGAQLAAPRRRARHRRRRRRHVRVRRGSVAHRRATAGTRWRPSRRSKHARVIRAARLYLDAEAPAAAGLSLRRRRRDLLGRRTISPTSSTSPTRSSRRLDQSHAAAARGQRRAVRRAALDQGQTVGLRSRPGRSSEVAADAEALAAGSCRPSSATCRRSRSCSGGRSCRSSARSRRPRSPRWTRTRGAQRAGAARLGSLRTRQQADAARALERRRCDGRHRAAGAARRRWCRGRTGARCVCPRMPPPRPTTASASARSAKRAAAAARSKRLEGNLMGTPWQVRGDLARALARTANRLTKPERRRHVTYTTIAVKRR